jgi:hypothetical protein
LRIVKNKTIIKKLYQKRYESLMISGANLQKREKFPVIFHIDIYLAFVTVARLNDTIA